MVKSRFKYFFGIIVFVYLLNNIGVPVYYHYCGGELESVSALFKSDGCCGEEEEDEDSDCCKNETKVISQLSDGFINFDNYKITPPLNELTYLNFKEPLIKNYDFTGTVLNSKIHFQIPKTGRELLKDKSVLII